MYIKLEIIFLEGFWVYKKSKARMRTGVGSGRVDSGKAVFFFSSLMIFVGSASRIFRKITILSMVLSTVLR